MVALTHVLYVSEKYNFKPFYLIFLKDWGEIGIDMFFVISGFIITYTQLNNKRTFLDFIKHRLLRIVPSYWFLTFFILIIYLINSNLFLSLEITNKLFFSSLFFISQIINDTYPLLNVGWSLEYEMFFYLLFSFFLFTNRLNFYLVFFLFIALILFSKEYLLAEFLFGIILCFIYQKIKQINVFFSKLLIFFGILFLLAAIPSLNFIEVNNNFERMIYFGIPSFLILFGFIYINQSGNYFLIFLGNASYSIYLVHLLTITIIYKIVLKFSFNFNNDFLAFFCLVLSILSGCLFYLLVEKNLNIYFKKKFSNLK